MLAVAVAMGRKKNKMQGGSALQHVMVPITEDEPVHLGLGGTPSASLNADNLSRHLARLNLGTSSSSMSRPADDSTSESSMSLGFR